MLLEYTTLLHCCNQIHHHSHGVICSICQLPGPLLIWYLIFIAKNVIRYIWIFSHGLFNIAFDLRGQFCNLGRLASKTLSSAHSQF